MIINLSRTTIAQCALWGFLILGVLWQQDLIPADLKPLAGVALAIGSIALHRASGIRNSNGTPQELPFIPDIPQIGSAAEAAYEAYRATVGTALPAWGEISTTMQTAFKASASAAQAHSGAFSQR